MSTNTKILINLLTKEVTRDLIIKKKDIVKKIKHEFSSIAPTEATLKQMLSDAKLLMEVPGGYLIVESLHFSLIQKALIENLFNLPEIELQTQLGILKCRMKHLKYLMVAINSIRETNNDIKTPDSSHLKQMVLYLKELGAVKIEQETKIQLIYQ